MGRRALLAALLLAVASPAFGQVKAVGRVSAVGRVMLKTGSSNTYTLRAADTGTDHLYFNSSEIGCTRSTTVASDVIGCDDVQDGDWYRCGSTDVDANGGNYTTQDGWYGSIYTTYGGSGCQWAPASGKGPTVSGAVVTGLTNGLGGATIAAIQGPYPGGSEWDTNYGLHDFYPAGSSYTDVWVRIYYRVSSGYDFGNRKLISFNNQPASFGPQIRIGGFGSGEADGKLYMCPTYDCTIGYWNPERPSGYNGSYLRANLPSAAAPVDLDLDAPANTDQWVYVEVHIKMESSVGTQDGVYEYWSDLCGSGPTPACTGSPTKRAYYDNVRWRDLADTSGGLESLMIEGYSGGPSAAADSGTMYWQYYRASNSGPVGFLTLPN